MLETPPYSLNSAQKEAVLLDELKTLTKRHYKLCPEYKAILQALGRNIEGITRVSDIPFLPVRLFKEFDLRSSEEILKTMTSSGTTGQQVSKIHLDKRTATNQTKVLAKIVSSFIGPKRLPLIILDSQAVVKDRNLFSARGAGILGFSVFGRDIFYALDDDMQLKLDELKSFIHEHKGKGILLFGFTFIVWQHFYNALKASGTKLDLEKGILIHGGGWKKLVDQSVSCEAFRSGLKNVCGIRRVHDYYGMVEQTGSIYMECEHGHLHTSIFSDVIIRDPIDFSQAGIGESGLLQVISVLPESYPGHSLLTEDIGTILGIDDCPCGRKGKYIAVHGRIKNAEIRGCSDTYAAN